MIAWESRAEAESQPFVNIHRHLGEHDWNKDFKIWEYPKVFFWLEGLAKGYDRPLRVMDFGCGECGFPQFLSQQGFDVWGVDNDSFGLMNKVDPWGLVNYYVGDISNLSMPFDVIVSCSVIEHIPPEQRVAIYQKMKELLGEHGKFCHVIDYYFPEKRGRDRDRVDLWQMAEFFGLNVDPALCPGSPEFDFEKIRGKIDFILPDHLEARILIGSDV